MELLQQAGRWLVLKFLGCVAHMLEQFVDRPPNQSFTKPSSSWLGCFRLSSALKSFHAA